ncbi:MAG: hypothetical protein KF823_04655 [Xanthomonadales bacterium]|nr:hypothetical protein [Xanthomonadales bacterium]
MSTRIHLSALLALAAAPAVADQTPVQAWQLGSALASTELGSPAARHGHRIELADGALAADRLRLPLPGGDVVVRRVDHQQRADGALWRGHVEGDPDHVATFTLHAGQLAGLVTLPGATWEIMPAGDGGADLLAIDHAGFPECAGDHPAPTIDTLAPTAVLGGPSPFLDRFDDIDVIIFYTAAARTGAGGEAQIQATAQAAVDNANTAFSQSALPHRFRLVAALELAFNESGNASTDLSAFRANATANAARNAYLADQAGLLVENGGGGCGIGYLMTVVGPGFAPNAFQVTARTCAVGNLTYAHEHGHNMGMAHNPENAGTAAYPYSYGHWNGLADTPASERFRTVMSYANPCVGGCTRRPYWSSPEINYMGVPTGVVDERDNARNMRNVGPTVANWRTKTILRFGFEN